MRSSSFGGSGDGPTPEQMETWSRRFTTPDNELPGSAMIGLLLGRTENVAVGITSVEAYTGGFSFKLAVRLRSERAGGLGHRLYELIAGHHHLQAQPPAADERLLLGLEYADGRIATNVTPMSLPADPRAGDLREDEVVLAQSEGGRGGAQVRAGLLGDTATAGRPSRLRLRMAGPRHRRDPKHGQRRADRRGGDPGAGAVAVAAGRTADVPSGAARTQQRLVRRRRASSSGPAREVAIAHPVAPFCQIFPPFRG